LSTEPLVSALNVARDGDHEHFASLAEILKGYYVLHDEPIGDLAEILNF